MVKTETKLIGPELAARLLERNTMNRPLSSRKVEIYAKYMANGEWQLNGEPIIVADTGKLLNGQHRLHAIIKCGKPQWATLTTGIKEAAFATIDNSPGRPNKDVLAVAGYKNPGTLSSAITYLIALKRNGTGEHLRVPPSKTEIVAFAESHPELCHYVSRAETYYKRFSALPKGDAAAMGYLFSLVNENKEREFFDGLTTGAGLSASSPVLALRNKLIEDKMSKASMPSRERRAWILKAWNAFAKGRKMRRIVFGQKEQYPQIEGLDYSEI